MGRLAALFAQRAAVAVALIAFFAIELTSGLAAGWFVGAAEAMGNRPDGFFAYVTRWFGHFSLLSAFIAIPASLAGFFLGVALAPSVPRIAQRLTFVCQIELAFYAFAMLLIVLFPRETPLSDLKGSIAAAADMFLYNAWWTLGITLLVAALAFVRVRSVLRP